MVRWSYLELVICPVIGPELLGRHAEGGKVEQGGNPTVQGWD